MIAVVRPKYTVRLLDPGSKDRWTEGTYSDRDEAIAVAKDYEDSGILRAAVLDANGDRIFPFPVERPGLPRPKTSKSRIKGNKRGKNEWIVLLPYGKRRTIALRKDGIVLSWDTESEAKAVAKQHPGAVVRHVPPLM